MATTTIPWGDGSGDNIYLTYTSASGNQTVQVSSDPNDGPARTKDITFVSTVGNIARVLTVTQETNMDYVSITWNDTCITFNDTGIAYPYEEDYIVFADSTVESILLAAGIGDGVGIKPSHAAAVTSLRQMFYLTNVPEAANISTFDELQYFTGLTDANDFMNGSSVTKITFPPGLVMGGGFGMYRGLRYCASLEDLDISDMTRGGSTLSTNQYLFSDCTSLTTLRVKSIESLIGFMPTTQRNDDTPFYYNTDTHYVYVDGVELINLVIPNTVTEIRPSTFYRFNRVTSVTIPNTVTSIGSNAFSGCSGLTGTVTIPSSVNSIGGSAFAGCSGLTDFIYNGTANVTMDVLFGSGNGTGTLSVGGDLTGAGQNSSAAKSFKHIIVGGNVTINGAGRSLINYVGAVSVRIAGNADFSSGYHISNKQLASFEFLEIGGTVSGGIFYNSTNAPTNYILHLGYNGVIALTDAGTIAADRASKIYVDSQAVLNQYLADSSWSAYSSKLDLWENYNGEYKN